MFKKWIYWELSLNNGNLNLELFYTEYDFALWVCSDSFEIRFSRTTEKVLVRQNSIGFEQVLNFNPFKGRDLKKISYNEYEQFVNNIKKLICFS